MKKRIGIYCDRPSQLARICFTIKDRIKEKILHVINTNSIAALTIETETCLYYIIYIPGIVESLRGWKFDEVWLSNVTYEHSNLISYWNNHLMNDGNKIKEY